MKFYLLIFTVLLTGCSTVPIAYNPQNIDASELATIKTSQSARLFGRGYNTWIEFVWDDANKEITNRNAFWDNMLGEVTLPAGRYKIKAACVNGTYEAHTEAVFVIEPSKYYELYCDIEKGKNLFGMSVDAYAALKIREEKGLNKPLNSDAASGAR